MPRPIPVYFVRPPSFVGQLVIGVLILGGIALMVKAAVIVAFWCFVALIAVRIARGWPGPFFSIAFICGGALLFAHSPGLQRGTS
jgi:uncharacterized membrane protein YphA (DoxX/SURF4 family)